MARVRTVHAFYLFVAALAVTLTSVMWGEGMFMDGMMYANVSRNLAEGNGTFWDMHFSQTLYPHFREHPPLAFFLESILFRLFGDHFYVERIYSFLTFAVNTILFIKIWQRLVPGNEGRQTGWFALLLWVSVYSITWGFMNNMLENTMMVFTSAAVLYILKSTETRRFPYLALGGIMLFLAVLSKGFTGLYIWALPAMLFVFVRSLSFSRALVDSVWLVICTCVPLLAIWFFWPEGKLSMEAYYHNQVVKSVSSIQTTDHRSYILERWLLEMLPAIGITLFVFMVGYVRKSFAPAKNIRWSLALFALGFSGILPIMVSMKQRTFYMNTTFIWFAMGFALLVLPTVSAWMQKMDGRPVWKKIGIPVSVIFLLSGIGICANNFGKPKRDYEMFNDVPQIISAVGQGQTVGLGIEYNEDWSLYSELNRKGKISLWPTLPENNTNEYFISSATGLAGYRQMPLHTQKYHLFKKDGPRPQPAN